MGTVDKIATLQVNMNGKIMEVTFWVAGIGSSDLLLGLPWLRQYNPRVDWSELKVEFPDQERPVQTTMRRREPTVRPQRGGINQIEVLCCYQLRRSDTPAFEIPHEYREFATLFEKESDKDSLPPHQP